VLEGTLKFKIGEERMQAIFEKYDCELVG